MYEQGVLSDLYVAFSRINPPCPTKYIQRQILANAAKVWELMYTSKKTFSILIIIPI